MNIAIPIRDRKTGLKDWELHHCIKSIRKYTNAEEIFVIGRPRGNPELPGGRVIWVDYRDKYRPVNPDRHENVRLKVLKAGEVIGKPFLLMNDDMFFLKKTDITQIPLYYWKTCKEFAKNKGGHYKSMLQQIDGLNFELHVPMIITPSVFKRATERGKLYRSLYGNASNRKKEELPDVKYYGRGNPERDWIISTNEAHMNRDVRTMIQKAVS